MLSYRLASPSVREDLAGIGGRDSLSSDSEDEENKELEAPTVSPPVAAPGSQEAFKLRSQLVHSMTETG